MSSNADACPHCGETAFYEREYRTVRKKVACDYHSGSWATKCKNGTYYAREILQSSDNLIHLTSLDWDYDNPNLEGWRRIVLPKDRKWVVYINPKDPSYYQVAQEILAGRYEFRAERDCSYYIYVRETTCPKCNGKGYIIEEQEEYVGRYDIRERVK